MNTTKKPIREWLDEIPDETIRKQAIENWEDYKAEDKNINVISLSEAIWGAFIWYNTPQGNDYWLYIAKRYEI